MATLNLTDEQLLVLRAAWEYFVESDDHLESMADALELTFEERGMDEDGEYIEGRDEESDPVALRINDLTSVILG
jgi:hypothetical protein